MVKGTKRNNVHLYEWVLGNGNRFNAFHDHTYRLVTAGEVIKARQGKISPGAAQPQYLEVNFNTHKTSKIPSRLLRNLKTRNMLKTREHMQRISDTHDKSKSVVDELAGAYRSLQEEKRHLTAERKALEEEIRREMSLVDSDTVSLPLQEEYEKLTEAFKGTFEVIDTFRKTSEVQAAEILEILRQRKTGQTLQLDMTGLVSDASTCSDMPEAIQVCSGGSQLQKLLLKIQIHRMYQSL